MVAEQPILRMTSDELQEEGREQVPDHSTDGAGRFVARGPRSERYDALDPRARQPLECLDGRGGLGEVTQAFRLDQFVLDRHRRPLPGTERGGASAVPD